MPTLEDCHERLLPRQGLRDFRTGSQHSRVLWLILAINATMLVVETIAGIVAHSTSLLADGLDMFGDASVYALMLFALSRSLQWQAGPHLRKASSWPSSGSACSPRPCRRYAPEFVKNYQMHLLVESADNWHAHVVASGVAERFAVDIGQPEDRPWMMRDFTFFDPSGVLWRVAQNLPKADSQRRLMA